MARGQHQGALGFRRQVRCAVNHVGVLQCRHGRQPQFATEQDGPGDRCGLTAKVLGHEVGACDLRGEVADRGEDVHPGVDVGLADELALLGS